MQESPFTAAKMVLIAIVFEGVVGVVAVGLGWLVGYPPLEEIRWSATELGSGASAALPMLAGLAICVWLPLRPFRDLLRVVEELLVPMFRQSRLVDLAVISALAGVGEEMLFRGVIQEAVAGTVGGPGGVWFGLAVAAVLFGLAHFITPTYAVLAGLMGVYLGWLWIATGNLLVPITAHGLYDFLALAYLVRIKPGRVPPDAAGGLDA